MNGKLMLSLLRSNPHKEHYLVTELQIRGVTGIDASMKWNELCKFTKEHENKRGCFTPMSDLFKDHREDILL
jgi:hypothetical protein